MQYGQIPGITKSISRLVQGTMMIHPDQLEQSFALLDAVYALGCTTFDTAHVYGGNGNSERTFGQWVRERGVRDRVVILGKGAHHNQDRQRVTPYDIQADLSDSLARFQLDHIDLYMLHRDDPSVAVGPIVEVLNEELNAGRISAFGGSNWDYRRIEAANEYATLHNLTPFVASSPNFSLARQVVEPWENCVSVSGPDGEEARAWYLAHQMPLFTWSSLAGGFFSGRFRRDNLDTFESYMEKTCVRSYCYEENFQRLDRVKELAKTKGLTVPQIATAYVMSQSVEIFALVGCQNGDEFRSNMEAMELKLTPEEIAWLELKD
jgi:aryl-alcohol dehydrogenase-like predicted oxidoreductase